MPFVGLVHARDDWRPPEPPEPPEPPPGRQWQVPWRAIAMVVAWWALLTWGPSLVHDTFGGLAGYVALLLVLVLGFWRLERWCSRQYWRGLRDYKL
jgi:hypothetical protein